MSLSVGHESAESKAVVYVESIWDGVRYGGTGVIVGNNDVLTSAHLVYNANLGGVADSTKISPLYVPGTANNIFYQDLAITFYSDYDPNHDRRVITGDGKADSLAGSEIDIALITVDENIGDIYGSMNIDFDFLEGAVSVLGHPGAYGRELTFDTGVGYQDPVDNVIKYHDAPELNPGNSGGPIYYLGANGPSVVGLVSTGKAATSFGAHREWLEAAMERNDTDPRIGTIVELGTHGNDQWMLDAEGVGYDGLDGHDSIVFSHSSTDVIVSAARNGSMSIHFKDAPDVLYQFDNVEELVFSDQTLNVSDLSWERAVASSDVATLAKLYVAYFDRTPDADGMEYWTTTLNEGLSLEEVCRYFASSQEFGDTYGRSVMDAPERFVDGIYQNVLDRAPDSAGLSFWTDALQSGAVTPDVFILSFINGSHPGTADFDYMQQRIEASTFTVSTLMMGNRMLAESAGQTDTGADTAALALDMAYARAVENDAAVITPLIGSGHDLMMEL